MKDPQRMATSFSSHAPLPKIIAPATVAQPLPLPLANLPTAMLVGTGEEMLFPGMCFSLLFPSLFQALPPPFFFFHFGLFPLFFCLCYYAYKGSGKPLGKGCLEHIELAPSLTSKSLLDFLLLSFQLLLPFPALETKPLPIEHEPFKGSRWLMRRKIVGRRMQMILDVFAIFISSRPCCWGNASSSLACCRFFPSVTQVLGYLMNI